MHTGFPFIGFVVRYNTEQMISRYQTDGLEWVLVQSPTTQEAKELMEEYGFNVHVADELTSSTLKPKIDLYDECVYGVLHMPVFKHTHHDETKRVQEIDFVMTEKTLITVCYESVDFLHKFSKEFETNSILESTSIGEHAGYLLYFVMKKMYKSIEHELEYCDSLIKRIEKDIFRGQEREMVEEISYVARILIDFKQTLRGHNTTLSSLEIAGRSFFGDDSKYRWRRIRGEYSRVMGSIAGKFETLTELRETNDSLVSTKQNEVMVVLTIMAFLTFPLSLIASLFGMETDHTPIVGQPFDFWIIVGMMAVLTIIFFGYFKYRDWL